MKNDTIKSELAFTARKSSIYVAGRFLTHAVGFFLIPVYTRFIVPENYGAMALIGIISSCISMFIFFGMTDGMPRFYYAESDINRRNIVVSTIMIGFGIFTLPFIWLLIS